MVLEIREFPNVREFISYIDKEVDVLRKALSEVLKEVEELRAKAEKARKLRETLARIVEGLEKTGSREVDLKDIKLVINPTVEDEARLMEDLISDMQERILTFQKVRKAIEPLMELGELPAAIKVVFKDGKPLKLLLRTT
ncbi:MAG: hypothetical protein DRO23_05095 [Thermoprotei archaeon]|nr:MAG: hypothetical protein DRO23_05095 [Thermoprotei archaeon]